MENFVLSLSTKETETVLNGLSNLPYKESAQVIQKIMTQVQKQQTQEIEEDNTDE